MNQAQFIGNLTADAVARTSHDGQGQYITFTVAVSNRQPDGTQQAQYIECTKNGDNSRLFPFLTKGKRVWVQGKISARAYTDKQGKPRASLDLRVYAFEFCGGGEQQAGQAAQQPVQQVTAQQPFTKNPPKDGSLFPEGIAEAKPKSKMQHESDLPF